MKTTLLGEILLETHKATPGQIAKALEVQATSKPRKLLGDVLVDQGVVDRATIENLMTTQARTMEIGRVHAGVSVKGIEERLRDAPLSGFLAVARELGASDLILSSGQRPVLRLHGNLVDLPAEPPSVAQARSLIESVMTEAERETYEVRKQVEFAFERPDVGRFKAGVFRHYHGIVGTFRVIPNRPPVFEQLGLPPVVRSFADLDHGLVLVAGPVGCGKSTTLASIVQAINERDSLHVVTIEEPIEFVYPAGRCLISQRQVGVHALSFADALRSSLREDPDVIVVGELRDPESVATAIQAAETGHLVFGTMNTHTAHRTIVRVLDQFPAAKRAQIRASLANVLRAVVCQQLIPEVSGRARAFASEVLVVNAAVSALIRDDKAWQIPMMMQVGGAEGMRLMDESLRELVAQRRISVEDALVRATERSRIIQP